MHHRLTRILPILFFLIALFAASSLAQPVEQLTGMLSGYVTSSETGTPIPDANIFIENTLYGTTSGDGPLNGTLAPDASVDITVAIDEDADSLPPGNYLDTVSFINLITGSGDTDRSVKLEVLITASCECDLNQDGSCNILDWPYFIEDWGRSDCNEPGVECECDLNGDGSCNILDWPYYIEDWGRVNCPLFEGFIEDFDDGVANYWVDDGSGTWTVEDGVYKMTGNRPPGQFYTSRYSYYDNGIFDDFTYEIEVNNLQGSLSSTL